jgi:hypothetical protein
MNNTAAIRRILRITFEGDSMRGSLDDGGRLQSFSGWLELLAAIEELRAAAQDRGPAGRRAITVDRPARGHGMANTTPPAIALESEPQGGAMSLTDNNHNETLVAARPAGLAVKTQLKARLGGQNHNETLVAARPAGVAVKTQLKARIGGTNHNETLVAARPAGVAVKPQLKAGFIGGR